MFVGALCLVMHETIKFVAETLPFNVWMREHETVWIQIEDMTWCKIDIFSFIYIVEDNTPKCIQHVWRKTSYDIWMLV